MTKREKPQQHQGLAVFNTMPSPQALTSQPFPHGVALVAEVCDAKLLRGLYRGA